MTPAGRAPRANPTPSPTTDAPDADILQRPRDPMPATRRPGRPRARHPDAPEISPRLRDAGGRRRRGGEERGKGRGVESRARGAARLESRDPTPRWSADPTPDAHPDGHVTRRPGGGPALPKDGRPGRARRGPCRRATSDHCRGRRGDRRTSARRAGRGHRDPAPAGTRLRGRPGRTARDVLPAHSADEAPGTQLCPGVLAGHHIPSNGRPGPPNPWGGIKQNGRRGLTLSSS